MTLVKEQQLLLTQIHVNNNNNKIIYKKLKV
jgi:hypothetical protein